MHSLSAVIITLNEERNILRCIKSLKETADEVIVVDSGSTDATEKICHENGVTFIYKEWGGYSDARNYGAEMAAHDWVLALDADEALSPELAGSINELKKSPGGIDAMVSRLTNYCGHWVKYCGWYPDKKYRIYNRRERKFRGIIHETVQPSFENPVLLKGDLLHYSYYTLEDHVKQYNKFTTLTAEDAFRNGTRSSLLKIVFSPVLKFIRSYFFQLGILDGYYGYIICRMSAHATFLKYCKLMMLQKRR